MAFGFFTEHYGESKIEDLAQEEPYSIRVVELKEGVILESSVEDTKVTLTKDAAGRAISTLRTGSIIKPSDEESEVIWAMRRRFSSYDLCIEHINAIYQERTWVYYRANFNHGEVFTF